MRLAVFAIDSFEAKRIWEEAVKSGVEADLWDYRKMQSCKLASYDIAIFRTVVDRHLGYDNTELVASLRNKIINAGKYVFNVHATYGYPLDKKEQENVFRRHKLPFVKSYAVNQLTSFPVICKLRSSSKGIGVFQISNQNELKKFVATHKVNKYIFQEQLELGHDYRVLVLGGKVLGVMERRAQEGKIVANYSQGGRIRRTTLVKKWLEVAVNAARVMKYEYAGVDLISDNQGDMRILEVNRCAQFKGFEQANKINVARKIVEYCLARI